MRFRQSFRAAVSLLTLLCFSSSAFSGLPQNTPKAPFVLLIQENHSDPGAQKMIAEIIQDYQSQMDIPLLAVEGASGEIPVEELREFPDSETKHKSAEILMDQLILDGASAAAIFSRKPMRFIGVENPDLYQKNLKVFREAKNDIVAKEFLKTRRNQLNKDLKKVSPELKKFYAAGDDFEKIFALAQESDPAVLGSALPKSKIYSPDFLLDHPKIRQTLAMQEFQRTLSVSSLLQIRDCLKKSLIKTNFDRAVDLEKTEIEKLENISQLKALRADLNISMPPSLAKAREFYDLARRRDAVMAENLIKNLKTSAILVTGGFHTAGITKILRSKGISYQVVTPKVKELSSREALYERRLAGDLGLQTLAAPRAVADPEFRVKLIRLWREGAASPQAMGASLGSPVIPQILDEMYPAKSDRYTVEPTSHGYYMETDIRLIEAALNESNVIPGMKVLDLGAGDGRVMVAAALRGAEAIGIEADNKLASSLNSKRRQFAHILRAHGIGKLRFEKGDFYQRSFSSYDIIFYSMGGTTDEAKLEWKIMDELKPGARFVVFTHVPVTRPLFENLETIPLSSSIPKKDRMFQVFRAPVSVKAKASSLGRFVERILVVGGAKNREELIKKINVSREFQVTEASGIQQAIELMQTAFSQKKAFDLVMSFLEVEDNGWVISAATADGLYDLMKKSLGMPPPLVILATEKDMKDKRLYSSLRIVRGWDEGKPKPEGFFGYFPFEFGYFRSRFDSEIIAELEKQYANQAVPVKRPPTMLKEIPKPSPKPRPSSRKLSPEDVTKREELARELAAAELQAKAEAKVAKKLEEEAKEAERKKAAARDAALELRLKAIQEEDARDEAARIAAEAERKRAEAETREIKILEDPILAEPAATDEKTPAPPAVWGQGAKGEVGEERRVMDILEETQRPTYADPPLPPDSVEHPFYKDGSDSPPSGTGASLGRFSLNRIQRVIAWFNRADRMKDSVVFLIQKQTLSELTDAERNEINYHLSQKSRRLLILHDRKDKDLNLFGLEGRVQHWWGSAEDYVQVLHRVRAPHVVYLSGAEDQVRFSESGVVNVKQALFAPTAAVEYLFQGGIDFYGIWKKENGRMELMLSEKVEMLFKEIAAARWALASA